MSTVYVALDLEATEMHPERGEILELGAIKFTRERVVDRWSATVRPRGSVPFAITSLTGITEAEVRRAPPFAAVAPTLAAFVRQHPIVGQSAWMDLDMLRAAGLNLANPVYDTFELATLLVPGLAVYSLSHVAAHLGVAPPVEHRALADELAPPVRVDGVGGGVLGIWRRGGAGEDVVGGDLQQPGAGGRAGAGEPGDRVAIDRGGPVFGGLGPVDVGPRRGVQHELRRHARRGRERHVPRVAREREGARELGGERMPELPAGARDQSASARSRSDRIGDCVLQRSTTRGSFHGTPCSSGSAGSYSSVTK